MPFSQGFAQTTEFQRNLLFGVLAATAISAALLIAPSAWHRIRFRQKDKELILSTANRMAIAGLGFLAIAMVGAVMLIANYAFSDTLTVVSGIAAALVFGGLWYALPLARGVEQLTSHPDGCADSWLRRVSHLLARWLQMGSSRPVLRRLRCVCAMAWRHLTFSSDIAHAVSRVAGLPNGQFPPPMRDPRKDRYAQTQDPAGCGNESLLAP